MTTETQSARVERAYASVKARAGSPCDVALILGSGLGQLADAVKNPVVIPYGEIDGFPVSTAPLHKGQLVIGDLFGRRTVVMQGRLHLYEGWNPRDIAMVIYFLKRLGPKTLVITNAAGGLNAEFGAGDLMLIEDHINFTGKSPLAGPNDDAIGVRFPDMSRAYDRDLARLALAAADRAGIPIRQGIYAGWHGPELETSAERRFLRSAGADAVGMSTVAEVISASHVGLPVVAISAVTNAATGGPEQEPDTLEKIVAVAVESGKKIEKILAELFPALPKA